MNEFAVPYEVTQRVDYTVIKQVPYIVSEQVPVTEYEKEPFTVEHTFDQTEWDKAFFTVTIEEPYVTEIWEHYTAQIQVPYEVTNIRELTVWELDSYVLDIEVPVVVENPTIHVDIQQEVSNVPTSDTVEHAHNVIHDKNFGLNAPAGSGLSIANGEGLSGIGEGVNLQAQRPIGGPGGL